MVQSGKVIGFGFLTTIIALFSAIIIPDFASSMLSYSNSQMNEIMLPIIMLYLAFGVLILLAGVKVKNV